MVFVGTIYLASGDTYTGDWKDGRRHGQGIYRYRWVMATFNYTYC